MGPSAGIFRPRIFSLQDSCIQGWMYSSLFLGLQSVSSTSSCSLLNFPRLRPFWASVNTFFPFKRSSPLAGMSTSPLSGGLVSEVGGVAIPRALRTFPHSHISFRSPGWLLDCLLAGCIWDVGNGVLMWPRLGPDLEPIFRMSLYFRYRKNKWRRSYCHSHCHSFYMDAVTTSQQDQEAGRHFLFSVQFSCWVSAAPLP